MNHTRRGRVGLFSAAIAFAGTLAFVTPGAAHADQITPPAVPGILTVSSGHKPFEEGHASGTQNYRCQTSGSAFAWTFTGPQATLQTNHGAIQHFLSPNPDEGGTARATWQSVLDGSTVWAKMIQSSDDAAFVAAGAIPWFLLEVVGAEDGFDGGDRLSQATYIQRVNTSGGRAPASGCDASTVGATQAVPYTADYFFYKDASAD